MPNRPLTWTDENDAMLRAMAADGKLAEQIGRRVGRPTSSVRDRAKVLGIAVLSLSQWRRQRGMPANGHSASQ